MPSIFQGSYNKPVGDVSLAPTHPLARLMSGAYLLNENGGGLFVDRGIGPAQGPAGGGRTDLVSGAAGFNGGRPCDRGPGVRFDGTGYLTGGNPSLCGSGNTGSPPGWSIACKFRITTVATGGIISVGNTSTSGQPSYLLQCNSTTNIRVLLGNVAFQTIVAPPVAGTWYTVVSTFSTPLALSQTGTEEHYLGVGASATRVISTSTATSSNPVNLDTSTNIYLGSGFSAPVACDIEFAYLWDRRLTFREAMELCFDPYQMWSPSPARARIAVAGVAETVTMDKWFHLPEPVRPRTEVVSYF